MRRKAIDYIKCLAALLVIHTHLAKLYPPSLGVFVWGGYFANHLFLFASGFCLTSVRESFPRWYGRRFVRVYAPYVLFLPLLFFAGELAGASWTEILMPLARYHFIPSILFLYIVYYCLTKLNQKTRFHYSAQLILFSAILLLDFFFLFDKSKSPIDEHYTVFETTNYLISMLLGGLAREGKWLKNKVASLGMVSAAFCCQWRTSCLKAGRWNSYRSLHWSVTLSSSSAEMRSCPSASRRT